MKAILQVYIRGKRTGFIRLSLHFAIKKDDRKSIASSGTRWFHT